MSQLLPIGALIVLGAVACWFDIKERRLPNWLCGLVLIAGLGLAAAGPTGLAGLGWHALHASVALLVGMALFAVRAIGGGDAKFYAAVAAWFPFEEGVRLLVYVALTGGLVLLAWAAVRKSKGQRVFAKSAADEDKLPYGVAIALGAVWLALAPVL